MRLFGKSVNLQGLFLFVFQAVAHGSLFYFVINLSRQFDGKDLALTFLTYFLFTGVGSDATYHRLLAHNSFKSPMWFNIIGHIFGTLGGVGSGIAWVANHRAHHRYVDTPQDPHSPHHKGWFWVQFLSMFEEVKIKFAARMLKDPIAVFFHKYYWGIHALYFLTLLTLYPKGIFTLYLVPAAMNWIMSAFINNICHLYGYRVAETADRSYNNFIIGLLSFGEGWHNYHHSHPSDYRCGHGKWEFDPVARMIEWVRIIPNGLKQETITSSTLNFNEES